MDEFCMDHMFGSIKFYPLVIIKDAVPTKLQLTLVVVIQQLCLDQFFHAIITHMPKTGMPKVGFTMFNRSNSSKNNTQSATSKNI
jgi:hypothetical protein